ncbi:hypothetical protein C1H46_041371 [Malus baccata]|uniref:Enoyl reductase (ER) domain-containing protein n=1 Tax=Malus baccata TaxID=106549 RepID=A0A540KFT8_MALBA|nr:hypothetical protein C1H46_041371 [Malus baccata]
MVMIRNLSCSLSRSAIAKTLLSPSNSRPSSHSAIPLLAPLAGQRLRNNSAAFEPEFRDTTTTRCLHSLGSGGGLPSSMRAAVFREPNKPLTFEEFHIPRPKSGELLIKTKGGLPIGSRVVGAFIMPCGNCSYCSKGHDDLCEDFFAYNRAKGTLYDGETRLFLRSSGKPVYMYSMGGLAEYCIVPANALTILPESLPYIESAVLGCAVFTAYGTMANAAQVKPGDSVAVIGIGGVGSSCLQIARAFGASDIIAVDVQDEKLQKAKIFGATHAVNAAKEDAVAKIMIIVVLLRCEIMPVCTWLVSSYTTPQRNISSFEDYIEWPHLRIIEITGGKGVDIAVEALGRPQTFLQCVQSVKDGGKAVMVGLSQAGAVGEVDINRLVRRKIQIIGSYGGRARQDLPKLVRLAESGIFDLANAVSRRYKFEESNEAFQELNKGSIVGRAVVEIM